MILNYFWMSFGRHQCDKNDSDPSDFWMHHWKNWNEQKKCSFQWCTARSTVGSRSERSWNFVHITDDTELQHSWCPISSRTWYLRKRKKGLQVQVNNCNEMDYCLSLLPLPLPLQILPPPYHRPNHSQTFQNNSLYNIFMMFFFSMIFSTFFWRFLVIMKSFVAFFGNFCYLTWYL